MKVDRCYSGKKKAVVGVDMRKMRNCKGMEESYWSGDRKDVLEWGQRRRETERGWKKGVGVGIGQNL